MPWSSNHTIQVHNASCNGCANHNPGLVGLPDGSFGGRTFSLYGSSFQNPGQWGRWHLFRSDVGVGPSADSCTTCAPNGCDHACSARGKTQRGTCKFPASTDPGKCCECDEYIDPKPCAKCAASAGGCVGLCIDAGHLAGMCGFGDGSPHGLCCTCFDEHLHDSLVIPSYNIKTDDGDARAQQLCGMGRSPLGTTRAFSLVGGRSPHLSWVRVVGADVVWSHLPMLPANATLTYVEAWAARSSRAPRAVSSSARATRMMI